MNPHDVRDRGPRIGKIRRQSSSGQPVVRVVLDWKSYFEEFRRKHGLYPLVHRGRLLFPDGWQYSMTDYRGPEWEPPEDPVQRMKLCLVYWYLRRKAVRRDLVVDRWTLDEVKSLAESRSVPLQQMSVYFDRESRKMVTARSPLDVSQYEGRVAWLETAILECDEMILRYTQEIRDADPSSFRSEAEGGPPVPPPGV